MKRLLLTLIALGTVFSAGVVRSEADFRLQTVIVDPGHGGKDPGALGRRGTREKDVVLQVARFLREALQRDGYRIVLTREEDVYLTLQERTELANRHDPNSSIFVSIHCNASENRAASGIETYVYNNEASDARARRLAARENLGNDFSLNFIFADMRQRALAPYSLALARAVHGSLIRDNGESVDRHVRRGPFYVLFYTTMPAVLVEIGFITNSQEEARLRSSAYQRQIAEAIAQGIRAYARQMDRWSLAARQNSAATGAE
ncbi:MAG: hypothetical protein KatS3mg115_1039 [Candidatus Poribacteria bacterium]|nr:MAG: hypothetical protein KatS3mg115_1039 [Candidatus Poribacteria bacterium]